MIQRLDATSAKSIPSPSTRKPIVRFGMISQTVYEIVVPARIVGSMETTNPNLRNAATKVAPSRRFGLLLSSTIGRTARKETMQARTGMKLMVFVGDILASAGCYVKGRDEVGYDRDDVLIENANEEK